ncbi:MAG: hypothetical protein F6K30_25750 [Cyanothece sp. SIO2G6]|nr:hypothetical protein [Cyanothece sp. SIO2G6]
MVKLLRQFRPIPIAIGAFLLTGGIFAHRLALGPTPALAQDSERSKVVVLEFDYADSNSWYSSYRGVGAARGVSELLINELVNDGTYSVIDSSQVGEDERWWYSVERSEALAAAQAQGIDAVIDGTITRFDVQEDEICVRVAFVRTCNEEMVATVQISVRIIDPTDGGILASAQTEQQVSANNASGAISGIGSGSSQGDEDDMLAEAVTLAVAELAPEIVDAQDKF